MHYRGAGLAASAALFVYFSSRCQRAAENGFAADVGSVSGDGRSFRCSTVGELLRDFDWVSVIAVREKCDEKGLRADQGHRSVRCRQLRRAPLRLSLRAGFLEKREKGAHRQLFSVLSKYKPVLYSLVKLWRTRPIDSPRFREHNYVHIAWDSPNLPTLPYSPGDTAEHTSSERP